MSPDQMIDEDEVNRAESEASRERKASGDTSPAQPDKTADDRVLTHHELAALYVWRTIQWWINDPLPAKKKREKSLKLLAWLETNDNMTMWLELTSHMMMAVGVGQWAHMLKQEIEMYGEGGVQ